MSSLRTSAGHEVKFFAKVADGRMLVTGTVSIVQSIRNAWLGLQSAAGLPAGLRLVMAGADDRMSV
jgi:hypothetical protein